MRVLAEDSACRVAQGTATSKVCDGQTHLQSERIASSKGCREGAGAGTDLAFSTASALLVFEAYSAPSLDAISINRVCCVLISSGRCIGCCVAQTLTAYTARYNDCCNSLGVCNPRNDRDL